LKGKASGVTANVGLLLTLVWSNWNPKVPLQCDEHEVFMRLRNVKMLLGVTVAVFAIAGLVGVSSKAHAGMIPYSTIGPHEYQFPDIAAHMAAQLQSKVRDLLKRHDSAFSAQDLNGVMKTYVAGPHIVLMGTGPSEVYEGKPGVEEAYRQFFARFDKGTLTFTYDWIFAGSSGDMAWFAAKGKVNGKVKDAVQDIGFNLSGTLLKQKGEWRIRAMHFSVLRSASEPEKEMNK